MAIERPGRAGVTLEETGQPRLLSHGPGGFATTQNPRTPPKESKQESKL